MMGSTLAFLVLACGISASTLNTIRILKQQFDTVITNTFRKVVLAVEIDHEQSDMVAAQRLIVLGCALKKTGEVEEGIRSYQEHLQSAMRSMEELSRLVQSREDRDRIADIARNFTAWGNAVSEIARAARAGDATEADRLRESKATPLFQNIERSSTTLVEQQLSLLAADRRNAEIAYARSVWIALALLGLSLAVVGGVSWIVRQINKSLHSVVADLTLGAEHLASAAGQVASASHALADDASQQNASLQETSASSEEINAMAHRNMENSDNAANFAAASQKELLGTNQALEQTVLAVDDINAQSGKIARIIKVIDEIAFQTNILALNAAVEAARAGEAGMGFAVVADEVRNLAQRSAQAAQDTAQLIEESIIKSRDGKARVAEMANSVRAITSDAENIHRIVVEVNQGSREQARGVQQIGRAISQMEQVTQNTSSHAEESAAAAQQLHAQSEMLSQVVGRLTALVGANSAALHAR